MPDDSITATAPAPRVAGPAPTGLPLAVPNAVKITELPEPVEPLDETEARTVVAAPKEAPPIAHAPATTPMARGGPPPDEANEADEPDDSVTTQAPSPLTGGRLPGEDEPRTSPPMLAPPSAAAGRIAASAAATGPAEEKDAYDDDESVTTRGPVIGEYEDDSVTAQAPVTRGATALPEALQHPPTFDETDGTTKKLPKRDQVPLFSTPATGLEGDPLDDSAEVRTAVMMNAPLRPTGGAPGPARLARAPVVASGPLGGGLAAIADLRSELREPASDSGLRVARAEAPSGDHASLGAIMASAGLPPMDRGERGSGIGPVESAVLDASMNPYREQAYGAPLGQPGPHNFDFGGKKPRYGLIVGVVATLSFLIPLLLFLWLHSNNVVEMMPRERSELSSDRVGRADAPRPKATTTATSAPPNATTTGRSAPKGPVLNRRR